MTANIKKAVFLAIVVALMIALPLLAGCGATATSVEPTADNFQLGPKPTGPERYVQDLAGILTDEEEKRLVDLSTKVEKDTTAEILFLTVTIADPDNINDLATRAGHEWGVGKADKDNGIVIAVGAKPGDFTSTNQGTRKRKGFIATGYGSEGPITDLQANDIFESQMKPAFLGNRWGDGLYAGGNAVAELFYAEKNGTGVANLTEPAVNRGVEETSGDSAGIILTIGVFGLLCAILGFWLIPPLFSKDIEDEAYTPTYSPHNDEDDGGVDLGTLAAGAVLGPSLGSSRSMDDTEGEDYHRSRRAPSDDDSGSSFSSGGGFDSGGFDSGGSFGGGDLGGGGGGGDC